MYLGVGAVGSWREGEVKFVALFSKTEPRQHAEGACGGEVVADATKQMKADLRLPLLQREA